MEPEIPELTKIGAFRLIVLEMLGEEKGMECLQSLGRRFGKQTVSIRADMSPSSFNWMSEEERDMSDHFAAMLCSFSEHLARVIGSIWQGGGLYLPANLAAERTFIRVREAWEDIAEDALSFSQDPALNKIFNDRFDDQVNRTASKPEDKKNNRLYAKALIKSLAATLPAEKRTLGMDVLVTYAMTRLTLDKLGKELHNGGAAGNKFTAYSQMMKTLDGLLDTLNGFSDKAGSQKKGLDGLMDAIIDSDEMSVTDNPDELKRRADMVQPKKRGRPSVH